MIRAIGDIVHLRPAVLHAGHSPHYAGDLKICGYLPLPFYKVERADGQLFPACACGSVSFYTIVRGEDVES